MVGEYLPEQPSLEGVRLKLDRAEQHLDSLEGEIAPYNQRSPHGVADQMEQHGDWFLIRLVVREEPDVRWGVRVGEFLHNLRSALDNLIWQLVLLNGETPTNANQFPIYTFRPNPDRIAERLRGVAPEHQTFIEELQPHLGLHIHRLPKLALRLLADLSNIDKHRYLHPAIGVIDPHKPLEALVECSHPILDHRLKTGFLRDDAELLAVRTAPEARVKMQGTVPHDVAFGQPHVTVSVLDGTHDQVCRIVERFAPAFD